MKSKVYSVGFRRIYCQKLTLIFIIIVFSSHLFHHLKLIIITFMLNCEYMGALPLRPPLNDTEAVIKYMNTCHTEQKFNRKLWRYFTKNTNTSSSGRFLRGKSRIHHLGNMNSCTTTMTVVDQQWHRLSHATSVVRAVDFA